MVIAVWHRPPPQLDLPVPMGVSAPTPPESLPAARAQAVTTARAARRRGLVGLIGAAQVATLSAIQGRDDLAALLLQTHEAVLAGLPRRAATLHTVRTWLECGRDADRTAELLFVHPNTVRNRVHTLCELLAMDPADPFQAVDLWWLCAVAIERTTTAAGQI